MASSEDAGGSSLATYVLKRWAWGHMSIPEMQRICDHAQKDIEACGGTPPTALTRLAGLGDRGRLPRNMYRDLQRFLCPSDFTVETFSVDMGRDHPEELAVLWPHATCQQEVL